jgi:Flp pilus assembly protein TadB
MKKLLEKFEQLGAQASAWKFYGIITPAFFLVIFIAFHFILNQTMTVMIIGWFLFVITCLIWWLWTLKIFQSLLISHKEFYTLLKQMSEEISHVKTDIKKISKKD